MHGNILQYQQKKNIYEEEVYILFCCVYLVGFAWDDGGTFYFLKLTSHKEDHWYLMELYQ